MPEVADRPLPENTMTFLASRACSKRGSSPELGVLHTRKVCEDRGSRFAPAATPRARVARQATPRCECVLRTMRRVRATQSSTLLCRTRGQQHGFLSAPSRALMRGLAKAVRRPRLLGDNSSCGQLRRTPQMYAQVRNTPSATSQHEVRCSTKGSAPRPRWAEQRENPATTRPLQQLLQCSFRSHSPTTRHMLPDLNRRQDCRLRLLCREGL